jgi:predicted HicB family RNase H-like nuclease
MYHLIYCDVKRNRHASVSVLCFRAMSPPRRQPPTAALNIRNLPRVTFFRLKMAAAAEEKSVADLVRELIEQKIRELEARGLLPKGKG